MMHWLRMGGPVMWFIAITFAGVIYIFIQRLLYLHRVQIKSGDFLKGIFNITLRGNVVEAVSLCEETPGPVAAMMRVALLEQKNGSERISRAMREVGVSEVPRLEARIPVLLTLAQIAPLLGLLGTVLGLIQAWIIIQQNAPLVTVADLSGAMWRALLTTAAGLAVAIPAYAAHNFLMSRVDSIVLDMERSFSEIMLFFSRDNSAEKI